MLKKEGDQWCSVTAGRVRPKTSSDPSAGPTTTSGAKPKCPTMPDPVEQLKDRVGRYATRMKEPPN